MDMRAVPGPIASRLSPTQAEAASLAHMASAARAARSCGVIVSLPRTALPPDDWVNPTGRSSLSRVHVGGGFGLAMRGGSAKGWA
jgi:hypothetical protein